MNYTQNKDSVIFELEFAGYFGSRDTYQNKNIFTPEDFAKEKINMSYNGRVYADGYGWRDEAEAKAQGLYNKSIRYKSGSKYILSPQEKEEDMFSYNDLGFWEYTEPEDDELQEAKEYLKSSPEKYTDQEIEEQEDTLFNDVKRAMVDAKESSYTAEYLQEYYKRTQESIEEDIADYLSNDFKMLDSLEDQEFLRNKSDQEFLRVEVSKDKIKEYLKTEGLNAKELDIDYIDLFIENVFDQLSAQEINTEYIDHYGTMGDTKDWLYNFKDYEETSAAIDNHRKDEEDKKNNLERASLELKPVIDKLNNYIDKYISKEPEKTKITRQIKALKSVIKNAV